MWTMLAGVPGKLKTLMDRLTATRAGNLDNLNATVSSRAPASTALTNAVWTDARAGKLDKIDGIEAGVIFCADDPTSLAPIAGGLPSNVSSVSNTGIQGVAPSQITAGNSHSYSGAGVLEIVALHNILGSGIAGSLTVTIDGAVALSWSGTVPAGQAVMCAGCMVGEAFSLGRVPFRASLTISCTGLAARYRYYKVA